MNEYMRLIRLSLRHVSSLSLESMIMPFLSMPTVAKTNGVHADDFLRPPSIAVQTKGVHVNAFVPPLPTAVEKWNGC